MTDTVTLIIWGRGSKRLWPSGSEWEGGLIAFNVWSINSAHWKSCKITLTLWNLSINDRHRGTDDFRGSKKKMTPKSGGGAGKFEPLQFLTVLSLLKPKVKKINFSTEILRELLFVHSVPHYKANTTPVLQKFTLLALRRLTPRPYVGNMQGPSPQEQLNKYMMELQSRRN